MKILNWNFLLKIKITKDAHACNHCNVIVSQFQIAIEKKKILTATYTSLMHKHMWFYLQVHWLNVYLQPKAAIFINCYFYLFIYKYLYTCIRSLHFTSVKLRETKINHFYGKTLTYHVQSTVASHLYCWFLQHFYKLHSSKNIHHTLCTDAILYKWERSVFNNSLNSNITSVPWASNC